MHDTRNSRPSYCSAQLQLSTWSKISGFCYRTEILKLFLKLPHELEWDKVLRFLIFLFLARNFKYYIHTPRVYGYIYRPRVFSRQKIGKCSHAKVWGSCASQQHSLSGLKVNWTTWNYCASKPTRTLGTCHGQPQVLSLSSRKHTQVRKAHCPWQYWHRSCCCMPRDACDMRMCLKNSCWQA